AFFALFAITLFGLSADKALAMVPTLSLYNSGNNSVQLTVNGDANATVNFYYYPNSSSVATPVTLGSTNQSGYFTTSLSSTSYNIGQNSSVYVIVNGSQSNMVVWPYNNNSNNNNN